ncbi:MAG: deoxyribose-phosphate aldolase [Chloroflexi bacterium]|nr:deoxyribose-phosphate aldolase [Chloroflexota bacterium]
MDRVGQIVSAGAERISAGLGAVPADRQLAEMIDHTLLKPDATPDQIAQLCFEARKFGFASVCINSAHVKLAADLLKGSPVKVCTVVGFPLGATPPEVKAYEAQKAIDEGATEVDMVINIGAIKARDYETAARDVRAVARACRASGMVLLKVIIEAALLTDEEKVAACLIAKAAGADFVKTSTGFGPGGATVADVQLMRRVVGPKMGVKAAGGIRTLADAEGLVAAGATRIGASAGVKILQEAAGAKSALKSGGREVLNE